MSLKVTEMGLSSRFKTRELAEIAVCTAMLFGAQVALASLPNIEVVTLLIMLYTHWFKRRTLLIIYVFAILEGVFYGFGFWWFGYLYVWTVLWAAVTLLGKKPRTSLFWAVLGGTFGLLFGFFYTFIYLVAGGTATAFAWWIAGIPWDIVHCIGNFTLILILYRLLDRLYWKLKK